MWARKARIQMRIVGTASLLLFILIVAADLCVAAEWRGIVPIRSTRADVVRLFNRCEEKTEQCTFNFGNQNVSFVFSGWQHAFSGCPKSVPDDTVLLVRARFNQPVAQREFELNLKQFKSYNPGGKSNRAYIDENAGLLVQSHEGSVIGVIYIATREDQSYCPRYYDNPRDFVEITEGGHMWPVVSVSCPPTSPRAGSKVPFVLVSANDDYDSIHWTITDGAILSGQGTKEITVDTTGLAGKKISATVEVKQFGHPTPASCEVLILPPLPD